MPFFVSIVWDTNGEYLLEWTFTFANNKDAQAFVESTKSQGTKIPFQIHTNNERNDIFLVTPLTSKFRRLPQSHLRKADYARSLLSLEKRIESWQRQDGKVNQLETPHIIERLTSKKCTHEHNKYLCQVLKRFEPVSQMSDLFLNNVVNPINAFIAYFVENTQPMTKEEVEDGDYSQTPKWHHLMNISMLDILRHDWYRIWLFRLI